MHLRCVPRRLGVALLDQGVQMPDLAMQVLDFLLALLLPFPRQLQDLIGLFQLGLQVIYRLRIVRSHLQCCLYLTCTTRNVAVQLTTLAYQPTLILMTHLQ